MLEIKNITKIYKTGDLVQQALKNVSLNLRDNEFVAILGPSGSGKTTLLNIIGGLDKYNSGNLIINNVSTKDYKDRDWDSYRNHTIGFVFQSYNLIPHQNVLRNVELALTIAGISAKERKQRALKALDEVGLKDQAYKKPNQMSGGQMQRVAIARALVNNPKILLADEPTGALDTQTSIQVMELLKEVAKDRLVVMVTHNPELANEYANRIVNLKDGEIVGDSNPYIINEIERVEPQKKNLGKAHMSFLTALSLSFNNLLTKKGRTILTAFAGSIGIIGIALILSLSQGFQNYIDKIQEDTMSSYPLTLQSDTADIFSALLTTSIESKEEVPPGKVKEVTILSSMMNSLGTNDLRSYKKWLEENEDLYKDDINKIAYSYSVTPRIYTNDATNTITQLHPSTLMSSLYSDSLSSAMSSFSSQTSSGAFSQTDFNELENRYTLIQGKFPKKYNEVLLVLPKENQISDLLVYMLGLRDNKELKTIIQEVMANEKATIDNVPLTFTYDDLMNVELKLIDATNLYKYNEKYDTYEDMSNDKDYMEDVYNNAEKLTITGIACSSGDNRSSGGVVYSKELTDYVIETAKKSEIVKKQLANKDIDVFSGNRFDEKEEKQKIDFNEMISIDEQALKDAFKINVSKDSFTTSSTDTQEFVDMITDVTTDYATNVYMDNIQKVITLTSTFVGIETKVYEATNMNLLNQTINLSDYESFANNLDKETIKFLLKNEATAYLFSDYAEMFEALSDNDLKNLADAIAIMFKGYYKSLENPLYGYDEENKTLPITFTSTLEYNYGQGENTIDSLTLLTNLISSEEILGSISNVYNGLISARTPMDIGIYSGTAAAKVSTKIVETISSAFGEDVMSIDTDKFAKAFNFDMDEEELSRLMSSMFTSSTASYSNNLINLGYQDIDDPSSISFYFKNFDTKEHFISLLDNYNENVNDEEKEISYTDITGLLMGSVKKIIDSVSYVLIAFVSVSLIVSSIMIAVITLISVMERTKEIGILRAMGASKHNVSSIFNAETFIIGLLSGLIGVGFTFAVIPLINNLIHSLTDNYDINAILPTKYAIILVLISVFLTMVAGLIPSSKASKQDPVVALRTE